MSYVLSISLTLGSSKAGLTLNAQLVDSDGNDYGSIITSGFVEIGNGYYLWKYDFPTGFRGAVKFFEASVPGTPLGLAAINPEEAELVQNLHQEGSVVTADEGTDGVTIRASVGGETVRIRQGEGVAATGGSIRIRQGIR